MEGTSIWTQSLAETRSEADWRQALQAYRIAPSTHACVRFIFQIASQVSEFYLGGDDTAFLLQLLAAPSEDSADVDLIATVLMPPAEDGGDAKYCFTARGEEALSLCACFMEHHPSSPALVQEADRSFSYIKCCLEDEDPWGRTPVSLQMLQAHMRKGSECEKLLFFLPSAAPQSRTASAQPRVSLERFPPRPSLTLT